MKGPGRNGGKDTRGLRVCVFFQCETYNTGFRKSAAKASGLSVGNWIFRQGCYQTNETPGRSPKGRRPFLALNIEFVMLQKKFRTHKDREQES
jgi:hypothetical protein